jgi:hypothetical protein
MENKNRIDYAIGIDPDLHRSGVAVYDIEAKRLIVCEVMTLWKLFDFLRSFAKVNASFIRLEHSPLQKCSSWHKGGKGAALNVGKSQGICIVLKEFLEFEKFEFELLPPSGYSVIFHKVETFKASTGWIKQTNEDSRAAAAMVFGYKESRKLT